MKSSKRSIRLNNKIKQEKAFEADNTSLISKRKSSKLSTGELAIATFLGANEIQFYSEFYFKDFKVIGGRKMLFFDFYIPNYKLCIEYDGEQHYTGKYKGKKLPNQSTNDFLKNAFCKSKGLQLLRIKYTDIDNIENILTAKFDSIDPINK